MGLPTEYAVGLADADRSAGVRPTTSGSMMESWQPVLPPTRTVATRPPSKPGHFWHDRAQRPTTFGWQRHESQATVRRFLSEVSAMTGTPDTWV